jgi:hypothetical protein
MPTSKPPVGSYKSCAARTRAGCQVAQAGFEMPLCNKMISRQLIGEAHHRFSACHVVGILRFQRYSSASSGDIERLVNVSCPTRIQEQSVQKQELAGKVLPFMLIFQPGQRPLCPGPPFDQ